MDDAEAAYIAGFFDGEGSLGIYSNGTTGRCLRAQITQAESKEARETLERWRARWGGSLCTLNRSLRRHAMIWQVSGDNAADFLREIRPWLRLKADQADIAIAWQSARPATRRDERGRILGRTPAERARDDLAAATLVAMKRPAAEPADLVEVRHTLGQILNVEGD
ncbi:hypothetical protein [Cellulomonas sp.]|uniref:hypothetical protein n=1 Tax=Cellulomonas sp. TaxID=40001 RepID=UPI001B1AD451|nr:hypothetical protein [Cellulomonas sp.]MBO9553478.1 hypothetical protein [Cellulomonas sp.]